MGMPKVGRQWLWKIDPPMSKVCALLSWTSAVRNLLTVHGATNLLSKKRCSAQRDFYEQGQVEAETFVRFANDRVSKVLRG